MIAPVLAEPAVYTLIVGAGFSYGVVPLVRELMHETIGDYYYPDQDGGSLERPVSVNRKDSARFWEAFNSGAVKENRPTIELDGKGLPRDPAAAYQSLFTYDGANSLFAEIEPKKRKALSFLERMKQKRAEALRAVGKGEEIQEEEKNYYGEMFVKGFLRYVLDPGCEHGYGSTGRNTLNPAHIYLAALLEAQQLGWGWTTRPFCRTILTTNFDTLLQNALQMVNLLYQITDRPEKGLHPSDFGQDEGPIHLIYTHGSILRHNPASAMHELAGLASGNIEVLRGHLQSRDVITIGYSGWNDSLMGALRLCDSSQHNLYWCDVRPEPPCHVVDLLMKRAGKAAYIHLDETGADGFMRNLYERLVPAQYQRDPIQRCGAWVKLIWNR